jgi:hypothetical protein
MRTQEQLPIFASLPSSSLPRPNPHSTVPLKTLILQLQDKAPLCFKMNNMPLFNLTVLFQLLWKRCSICKREVIFCQIILQYLAEE